MEFGHEIKPGQIIIKDHNVLRAILERQYSPILIQIICDMAKDHGCVITSAYRENDEGVHGHMRGIDCRSWCYQDAKAWQIMGEINNRWEYDHKRPDKKCCILHKTKNGGLHLHIQVHPNTRRRAV